MMEIDSWALPPIEKIYEAYSAIADDRVKILSGYALVSSSDYKKQYTVEWNDDVYYSNDNASYWQGYFGYPVIAVLMLQGRLKFDNDIAGYFKHINWKLLNSQFMNQYDKAVGFVLDKLESEGKDINSIEKDVEHIYAQIEQLDIKHSRRKLSARKQ